MRRFSKDLYSNGMTVEERIKTVSKVPKKKYVRKTKTKAEKDLDEYNAMLQTIEERKEPPKKEKPAPVIKEEEKEWDVPITEKVTFFDPSLSYELTGYRPINKDKGLDFDPKLFTVAADTYRQDGLYTHYHQDTYKWQQHWMSEIDKCTKGVTIGKYTLTGQNYFFLNYYRLLSPVVQDDTGGHRAEDFPIFVNKLYEYFHYLELCKKAGYDGIAFKSRGVN